MNKRHQVFVSSTYLDLRSERHEVMQALLEMDGIPAGMELWPSTTDDSWTLIRRIIRESDYYLVVVGGKYGSVDAAGVSFTEREYDYAIEMGKPVMAFVHGDQDAIVTGKAELNAPKREALQRFRDKLMSTRFCRQWTSAAQLGALVSRAFAQIKNTHPAIGWIHASEAVAPSVLVELGQAKEELLQLKAQLKSARLAAPVESEVLKRGDDTTVMRFALTDTDDDERIDSRVTVTWDQVFKMVGPVMLEPLREELLKSRFVSELLRYAAVRRGITQWKEGATWDEDFQRAKIQMSALGLIERAPRPSGDNQHTFWKVSPYGESYLMSLIAERRKIPVRRRNR